MRVTIYSCVRGGRGGWGLGRDANTTNKLRRMGEGWQ